MKTISISIPTNRKELKDFFKTIFGWMTHRDRMKNNQKVLNDLYKDIYYELNSGYWSKDISDYMKKELTSGTYSKINQMFYKAKKRLV